MIFILVGTHTQPFDRLLRKIDDLIEDKKIKEGVIAQTGVSEYIPKNYKYKKFFPDGERTSLIKSASMIITHAGAGSIIDSIKNRKCVIVVPRLKIFGEHVNNHQLELAKALESAGKVIAVYNIDDLDRAIFSARKFKFKSAGKNHLVEKLKNYVSAVGEKK